MTTMVDTGMANSERSRLRANRASSSHVDVLAEGGAISEVVIPVRGEPGLRVGDDVNGVNVMVLDGPILAAELVRCMAFHP